MVSGVWRQVIYLNKLLKADPVARSYLWMYRSDVTCRLCRETKRQAPLISRKWSVRTLSRQLASLRGKRALSSRADATQAPKISRDAQVHVHLQLICPLSWIISDLAQLSLHLYDGCVAPDLKEVPADCFFGYFETLFQLHIVTTTWIIRYISAHTYGKNVSSGGSPRVVPLLKYGSLWWARHAARREKYFRPVCCMFFQQRTCHFHYSG